MTSVSGRRQHVDAENKMAFLDAVLFQLVGELGSKRTSGKRARVRTVRKVLLSVTVDH